MIESTLSRPNARSSFSVLWATAIATLACCVLLLPSSEARGGPSTNKAAGVRLDTATVNGLVVDRYTWQDSKGWPRTASLVRYGQTLNGQPRGGYAARFTYQVFEQATGRWRTVAINAPTDRGDAGFGYFVSQKTTRGRRG